MKTTQSFLVFAHSSLLELERLGTPSDTNFVDGTVIHALLILAKDGLLADVDPPTAADRALLPDTFEHLERTRQMLEDMGALHGVRENLRQNGRLRQLQIV